MSTTFGRNQKWIVRPDAHAVIRRALTEAFGASAKSPQPNLELFTLAGGENIGVFVEKDALDAAQYKKTAWLEFIVDDVERTEKALLAAGVSRVDYDGDKTHPYFQAGASPVFRLAKK